MTAPRMFLAMCALLALAGLALETLTAPRNYIYYGEPRD